MGVLAYRPLPKNRKSGFGHAIAQNRAHISTVDNQPTLFGKVSKLPVIVISL